MWAIVNGIIGWGGWLGFGAIPIATAVGVAWFIPPARKGAVIAALLWASHFGIYTWGNHNAREDCEAATLRDQLAAANAVIATLNQRVTAVQLAGAADAVRAAAAASKLAELEGLANDTPANAAACLPDDAAGRVRNIR